MSSDDASPLKDHPPCLSVRENRLLAHIDQWLSKLFTPENIEATATSILTADSEDRREDPEVARARITLVESEHRLAKHLEGLEAGIRAEVIAPRIAATQREKAAAEAVIASAPPIPQPLALDEVIETLSMLRDLPELLGAIEQTDRAARHQALASTSPTGVWEPMSKCASEPHSVPWSWSESVYEVPKKTPWYQLCEAWSWSVSEGV